MMSSRQLTLLSGGAAQGLVQALAAAFERDTQCRISGSFGAVGAMRDKLLAGEPVDLVILTSALIVELATTGHVRPDTLVDIGTVQTAIAVRAGGSRPEISSADALRSTLLAPDEIYFPDPKLATAGIHFAKVLAKLGIADEVTLRLRPHPNGATAMRALAEARSGNPLGCTQVTEILSTPGVSLIGALPTGFGLSTVYTAAVATRAAHPDEARKLIDLLAGASSHGMRESAGFGPI
jgi:molybdate transport system substrate-binding protein